MFQEQLNPDFLLITLPIAAVTLVGFYLLNAQRKKSIRIQKLQKSNFLFQIEHEKIKIARELHDTITPFTLPLKDFIRRGGDFNENNRQEWLSEISKFEQYLSNINESIFPVELLESDLLEALRKFCIKLNFDNIKIELSTDLQLPISRNFSIQIYRILQESLLNAIKYSGSPFYKIIVLQKKHDLICLLRYEAKDPEKPLPTKNSFRRGLRIINQRLELLSGKYDVVLQKNIKTEKFIFKNIFS